MLRSVMSLMVSLSCGFTFAILRSSVAGAQEQAQFFSYSTYLECDPARVSRADTLVRQAFAPVLDRHVAAKHLSSWGWLAHNTGGYWSRAGFMVARGRDQLLEGRAAALQDIQKSGVFAELFRICPRHEDYIWRLVALSRGEAQGPSRSAAARSSVYYECSPAREPRADSLVTQVFAPIWDRQLKTTALNSWSWHQHAVGGKYRRLLILDGGSHQTILTAIDSIQAQTRRERPAESREFGEICFSHQDYLWDVRAAAK
jgi:hypothetical protein